jgi:hypothetical protein
MGEYSELFVAFDVAKKKHAVAIAEGGRQGEIRFVGEIEALGSDFTSTAIAPPLAIAGSKSGTQPLVPIGGLARNETESGIACTGKPPGERRSGL